jgi:hypothetical protein
VSSLLRHLGAPLGLRTRIFLSAWAHGLRLKGRDRDDRGLMATHPSEAAACDDSAGDTLSPAEICAAIDRFSDLDWLRVKKAALYFSGRCRVEWRELQNEALVRSLDGRRKCPKRVRVTTFLANVIRSIASERDELEGHLVLSAELEAQQDSAAGLTPLMEPADPVASTIDAISLIEKAIATLGDDHIAELLLEGVIEGKEGQELHQFLGLGQKEFDSKRRFVRRHINQHFERKSR